MKTNQVVDNELLPELTCIIDILQAARSKITDDANLTWSGYDNVKKLQEEVDNEIELLKLGDTSRIDNVKKLFLPTSTFQEMSLTNGWSEDFDQLAEDFENHYDRLIINPLFSRKSKNASKPDNETKLNLGRHEECKLFKLILKVFRLKKR